MNRTFIIRKTDREYFYNLKNPGDWYEAVHKDTGELYFVGSLDELTELIESNGDKYIVLKDELLIEPINE